MELLHADSNSCWLSLTAFPSSMELLFVSRCLLLFLAVPQCLLWLLAVPDCLSNPMELLHVSQCLPLLLAVFHCLSGPMSCCMSLTVSYGCYLSLTVSPSSIELLHLSIYLLWLLAVSHCLYHCNGADT